MFLGTALFSSALGTLEAGELARCRTVVEIPQPLALDVEHEVEAWQSGDNVAVLWIEVSKGGIVAEDIHALPLRKDHADRTVFEDHSCLALPKPSRRLMD